MSALTFKLNDADPRKINTLRQAIKAKLPVLVLQEVVVVTITTQYDNQYIDDRIGNIPVNSLDMRLVGTEVHLKVTNATQEVKMVTANDFTIGSAATQLFPPTELRTYDGVVHTLPIELLDLNPGEVVEFTATIQRALTGDNGRYSVAPVCHFKGVMDEAAAAKAYEQLSEELKTDEHRKNWDNLYSHQYTVPNAFTFVLEVLPNCGYTNTTALAAACDIIVDSITASKMWKVKVEDEDGTHMEIVMDEYVGYLFENELQGKPGMQFVKYGKRHPHDQTGTLRIKTTSAEVDVTKMIQQAVEPLRRFYVGIASGVGGRRLHPHLQKALDAFKRSSEPEKRERLLELGVERSRAESAPEADLDTMAEVWLQQTERAASDLGAKKEKDKEAEAEAEAEAKAEAEAEPEKVEKEEPLLREDQPAEADP